MNCVGNQHSARLTLWYCSPRMGSKSKDGSRQDHSVGLPWAELNLGNRLERPRL